MEIEGKTDHVNIGKPGKEQAEFDSEKADYILFHSPFTKLVQKAAARLVELRMAILMHNSYLMIFWTITRMSALHISNISRTFH